MSKRYRPPTEPPSAAQLEMLESYFEGDIGKLSASKQRAVDAANLALLDDYKRLLERLKDERP